MSDVDLFDALADDDSPESLAADLAFMLADDADDAFPPCGIEPLMVF